MPRFPTAPLTPSVIPPRPQRLPRAVSLAVALLAAGAAAALSWTLLTPRHQRIHERADHRAQLRALAPAPAMLEHRIDRAALDTLATTAGRGSARIVPALRHGQPVGFKLYAIRPGSLAAELGLKNGDTLHRINGHELSSPERALAAYQHLRRADRVELELTRAGEPLVIRVAID